MVITVTYFAGFRDQISENENNRYYLHVRGDLLLANAKECKEPEEKQIFLMLCLLLNLLV